MDPIEETTETYNKNAKEYFEGRLKLNVPGISKNFLDNFRGKTILDVGCGPGVYSKYFTQLGYKVTGVDLSHKFVKIASDFVPNAEFFQMDMRKLDFSNNNFDGIFANACLLHIPKEQATYVLQEFHRVLNNEGLLYIVVKEGEGEKMLNEDIEGRRHFSFYSEPEIKTLVKTMGFTATTNIKETPKINWIEIYARKI